MVQEPTRASQPGDVLPREPVTRGVTPTPVLTRAHEDVVHDVKVVVISDVTRGLGEHLALVLPPLHLTRVHIHPGSGARHAGVTHLQGVTVPQQVTEGGRHCVLRERLLMSLCVIRGYLGIPGPPVTATMSETLVLASSNECLDAS